MVVRAEAQERSETRAIISASGGTWQSKLFQVRELAERGNSFAQLSLGEFYYHGKSGFSEIDLAGSGVEHRVDLKEARVWYRLAAAGGNARAAYQAGLMSFRGEGGERNTAEAERLFRLASDRGEHYGAVRLAELLLRLGHEREEEAAQLLEAAATNPRNTLRAGVELLGDLYLDGRGVRKSGSKAASLYEDAALFDLSASYKLAKLLEAGSFVPKDRVRAYMFFNVSSGFGDSSVRRDLLESQMTREQISKAEELSRSWLEAQAKAIRVALGRDDEGK